VLSQGYLLAPRGDAAAGHELCGTQALRGATCPNCRKPLYQVLRLRPDPRLPGLPGTVTLLYCWRCQLPTADFTYQLVGDDAVKVLACARGRRPPAEFIEPEGGAFPGRPVELVPLSAEDQAIIRAYNRGAAWDDHPREKRHLADVQHQVGGEPRFAFGVIESRRCPRCRGDMGVLAAIADDATPGGFVGCGDVQTLFYLCAGCRVITAFQRVG
jgi:hypothetical protein